MINIWSYFIGDKLKITDCDDAIFIGRVEAVTAAEERSDLEAVFKEE